jgi:hypothetical protein
MPTKDNEFDSLFEDDKLDDKSKDLEDLFNLNKEHESHEIIKEEIPKATTAPVKPAVIKKKRSSEDFEPDMDALFIGAQSPFIAEGLKYLTVKDFSSATYDIYAEAIKGVEVFMKILDRNPNNYFKLSKVINSDPDCKEIETVAFKLFRAKHKGLPESDKQIYEAYEMLRNRLRIGYNKAKVSASMVDLKKYYLLSGMIDKVKIDDLIAKNDKEFKLDMVNYCQNVSIATQLIKIGDYEISKGLKGKDMNTYLIKSSRLLMYYFHDTGDAKSEDHYRRIFENYKKYILTP